MRKLIIVLLSGLCVVLGGLVFWLRLQQDTEPPEVLLPEERISYEERADRSPMLEGVRATDEVDGDVSDTLFVESVIPLQDGVSAKVIYYAKDHSNNVAKVERVVNYTSEKETESETEPETETESESEFEIESESESETETETEQPGENPGISLMTDCATVSISRGYDLFSFVKDIRDDKDEEDWLWSQIHIDGKNDVVGPGVYELIYSVVDREGHLSNGAKLTLTVIE